MTGLLLAAGLVLAAGLALAGSGRLYRQDQAGLAPASRARLMAAALAGAVAAVYCGLTVLAIPAVLQMLPRSACPAWALFVYGGGPAGRAASWLAVCLLLLSAYSVAARARRCRRERRVLRVEHGLGMHEQRAGFDVVTVPGSALVAYSIRGGRSQIVLSEGLRGRLDDKGLTAVLAHEAAHLRARHGYWLQVTSMIEAALWFAPWVRRSADVIRLSLERWADEEAAGQVGRQTLRAALMTAADLKPAPVPAAALSGADAMAERLTALTGPREGSGLRLADMSSLAAMTVMALIGTGGLSAAMIAIHQLCGT